VYLSAGNFQALCPDGYGYTKPYPGEGMSGRLLSITKFTILGNILSTSTNAFGNFCQTSIDALKISDQLFRSLIL
jgi:hypothetical protein